MKKGTPLYTSLEPEAFADRLEERLIQLGCSPEYAKESREDALERAVKVESSYDANRIASGRES